MKDHQDGAIPGAFEHPRITAHGARRASVRLERLRTLWFNTGTVCNITCANCYIESSPTNDRLAYLELDDVVTYLDQIDNIGWPVQEIGFTGGEPFMNPRMPAMAGVCLERGFEVLVLTNAMRPMTRPHVMAELRSLNERYGDRLTLRVSVDHWSQQKHDLERGPGTFGTTLEGMRVLRDAGIRMTVAGRKRWGESDNEARIGYARLFAENGFDIDAHEPTETVLFPEMDETEPVPEITNECWKLLGKSPNDVMCASSRMVVKRRGTSNPTVLACTLIPYSPDFELGMSLAEADREVYLNHPHCSKFCVLGGATCSS